MKALISNARTQFIIDELFSIFFRLVDDQSFSVHIEAKDFEEFWSDDLEKKKKKEKKRRRAIQTHFLLDVRTEQVFCTPYVVNGCMIQVKKTVS